MKKILIYHLGGFNKTEGVGSVALSIAENLEGYKITLLSPKRMRKILFYSFLSPLWFAFKAFKEKPDLVFVHTLEASFDPIIAKKLFGFKYKVLTLAHGTTKGVLEAYLFERKLNNTNMGFSFELNLRMSNFRAGFARFSDKVTCVSSYVQKELSLYYGINAEVIPNGINLLPKREKPKIQGEVKTILFAGNLYWLKGLHYLIKANNLLSVPKKIIAVGISPAQEEKLKQIVDCFNVDFLGMIKNEELLKLYPKVDLFAMPSMYESFGITYLEALSNKVPVIASCKTGAEDIVKHKVNGYLVEKGNIESIKGALEYCEKNRASFRISPSDFAKFSWTKIGRKYKEVISSILEG